MNRFGVFGLAAIAVAAAIVTTSCDNAAPPRIHNCTLDGHTWGDWVVLFRPTCTDEGRKTRACTHDATHTETVPTEPLGHEWGEWKETSAPTALEFGEETKTCRRSESCRKTRPIPPTHDCERDGHYWGEWVISIVPTIIGLGEEAKTCLRCGEYETSPIPQLEGFRISSAGANHGLALRTDGALWAWGSNVFGQLGDGTMECRDSPVRIRAGREWASVSAGANHTVALGTDGSLWAWGAGGRLGDDSAYNRGSPVRIQAGTEWASVSAGGMHTMAIREDGSLWAWGSNWPAGQLGDGATRFVLFDPESPELGGVDVHEDSHTPVQIQPGTTWKTVSAGMMHTVAIRGDGSLWAWGGNGFGQLGDGTTENRSTPVRIGAEADWVSVSAGYEHTMAIRGDGSLWAWGSNGFGRTGLGRTTGNTATPGQVRPDTTWGNVSAGDLHTVAVKTDGTLWAWGFNMNGELGDGTRSNRSSPVQVAAD